ncbi:MAG TPA: death-on-curing protein [Lentisphaeria bacterium]|nr:MAG: death-on-curing protein [Lentisphaerae bacterium GWF2_38_69]HBM16143.1 death-on-curing protein [Lentisphaeria bacterium]
MKSKELKSEILIYKTADNKTEIEVQFDKDTVWLTQQQMASLFNQTKQNISLHINNCFKEKELNNISVVKESLTTASDGKNYLTKYYNLDVIISVGYRVKSIRGTQFRQWATQRLKDYLLQGYALNEKRLKEKQQEIEYLKTGIRILNRAMEEQVQEKDSSELKLFSKGLELLDDYDHEKLDAKGKTIATNVIYPTVSEYLDIVFEMKSEFSSDVFAKLKDESFNSSINQIGQGFGDNDLYPSLEEKAATLLYLIVKNHSFVDGNKRIGAACLIYFLKRNNLLLNDKNEPIISNEALAALTIFVASSKSKEMDTVKKLIISILNRK